MENERQWRIRRSTSSVHQPQQSNAVADSHDADDAVDRQSGPERRLGVLLEDHEDLLLRVLSCVMDDGLHECRLVCRRWRDACRHLPVRLGGSYLDNLDRLTGLFPEAMSVTMTRPFDSTDVVGRQAIENLSRLKNLQDLSLTMTSPQADTNTLVVLLPFADCLRTLHVFLNQEDRMHDVLQALHFLTNLEVLTLSLIPNYEESTLGVLPFFQTDLDPVTELRELRCLNADFPIIINRNRELLFPSLTKLTRLGVHDNTSGHSHASFSLQVHKPSQRNSYL